MFPFTYIIREIFLFSYKLTDNYGLSILLLSFAISLLLLPVFIYIEKAKKKDDKIKQKMKPLIDEIKRAYKGQERFYYIKTINRQHNYSAFKALIPILSLLLQIPFFIAAYQFLEHYEPLKEVGFLFIHNLSLPDAVFGKIHLLPIIMTLVNLITVYFYTIDGDGSERKQMLVLAGAFLILLFNLPSGLVLYWTMNNIFSFFRLFITNPEVFKSNKQRSTIRNIKTFFNEQFPLLKKVFIIFSISLVVLQFYWAYKHSFHGFGLRLFLALIVAFIFSVGLILIISFYQQHKDKILNFKIKPLFYCSLIFSTVYFYLAGTYYFTGVQNDLLLFSLLSLLPLQFFGYSTVQKTLLSSQNKIHKYINFLLLFLLSIQIIALISYLLGHEFSFSAGKLHMSVQKASLVDIILPGFLFSILTTFYFSRNFQLKTQNIGKKEYIAYLLASLYLSGFIFLWNPLSIYSSYPANFEFPAINILKNNLLLFLSVTSALLVLLFLLPKKVKAIWFSILLTLSLLSFTHNTLIPINVGTLQESRFVAAENIAQALLHYILEAIYIILLFLFIQWIIKKKKMQYLLLSFLVLNIILIFNSLNNAIKTNVFFHKKEIVSEHNISFSKEQKNIVYVLMDMFHGWHMDKILREDAALSETFEGFVWYPNTVSISSNTAASIASLLGGYDYSPYKMNQDKTQNLSQKLTKISTQFYQKVKAKHYRFTSTKMIYSNIDKNKFDTFLPKWHTDWNRWNRELNIGMDKETGYALLWQNALFYSAPIFLKPKIYNQGKWFQGDTPRRENTSEAKPYNFLKLLPYISNTQSTEPNFIYIHNMASHHPWNTIDDQGIMHTDRSPYQNNKWTIETFAKWIEWMKKEGVYDNTKIIVFSDHGPHWGFYKGKEKDVPMILNPNLKINYYDLQGLYPLLLVKDFGSKGKLRRDKRIMSNADATYIAFEENDPTKIEPPLERSLPSSVVKWERKIWLQNQFNILYQFEVSNNVYDLKNWKQIKH